jgi:hypothetical protein
MNKHSPRAFILSLCGVTVCSLPVFLVAASYFPAWVERGDGSAVSGMFLLLFILAATPIFKALKMIFHSPASYAMWLVSFLLFFSLEKIAHEMTVISLVGFLSNLCGALLFRLAASGKEK